MKEKGEAVMRIELATSKKERKSTAHRCEGLGKRSGSRQQTDRHDAANDKDLRSSARLSVSSVCLSLPSSETRSARHAQLKESEIRPPEIPSPKDSAFLANMRSHEKIFH